MVIYITIFLFRPLKQSFSAFFYSMSVQETHLPENLTVKRSARRKHIAVKLGADGSVELLAPLGASDAVLLKAWEHFQPWLHEKTTHLQQLPSQFRPRRFHFAIGGKFFFCGGEYELKRLENSNSRLIVWRDNALWSSSEDPAEIRRMLEAFYRRQTRRLAAGKLERYSSQFNIAVGEISITGARKRLGSCNSRGDINFSWLLGMYPERLQELVILHELAHRKEMNHARRFYQVLASFLPDHRERDRELKLWTRMLSTYPD